MANLSPATMPTGDIVFGPDPYYDPYYYDPYYVPPPVVIDPFPSIVLGGGGRRRRHRRGLYGRRRRGSPGRHRGFGIRSEMNGDEFTDDVFEQTECGYDGAHNRPGDDDDDDQEGEDDEPLVEDTEEFAERRDMPTEREVRSQYLKNCAEHPLAAADHHFAKLLCNACNGHTITLDGKPHEHFHADSCLVMKTGAAVAAAKKEKNIGCNECGGKGHHHHVVVVPPPEVVQCSPPEPVCPKKAAPPPTVIQLQPQEEEECEDESSTESDCEEVCEEEDPCAKKAGSSTVVEVYMDDEATLGKKLLEAQANNKSIRAVFNKNILAKDGKSAMQVKCCVTTNVVDAQGRPSFSLGMTPVLRSSSKAAATISANLWTFDAKSKRVALNIDAARQFYDAGVQKEVLSSVVAHVESALNKAKK